MKELSEHRGSCRVFYHEQTCTCGAACPACYSTSMNSKSATIYRMIDLDPVEIDLILKELGTAVKLANLHGGYIHIEVKKDDPDNTN